MVGPSEKAIAEALFQQWRLAGVKGSLIGVIPNARAFGQAGLTKGLSDLIVLSPKLAPCVAFVELKKDETSRLSPAQREFRDLCTRLKVPHFVTIGRDEPVDLLKELGALR